MTDDELFALLRQGIVPENLKAKAGQYQRFLRTKDSFKKTYRDHFDWFIHDCIKWPDGQGPTDYQTEIAAEMSVRRRVAIRSPHGAGKSCQSAWAVWWLMTTRDMVTDWKVITTASSWVQLTAYLWPEIRKWHNQIKWENIGMLSPRPDKEILQHKLIGKTGEAFAVSTRESALIEGAHASDIAAVFDEAKYIADDIWNALEGAFSFGEIHALAISTPGDPHGRFYEFFHDRVKYDSWWVRHITLDEALKAGRITKQWVAEKKQEWGENSILYQNRVLGEFATKSEESIIGLQMVEAATDRWKAWQSSGGQTEGFACLGVDVAFSGEDKSVLAFRYSNVITEIRYFTDRDPMEIANMVMGIIKKLGGYAVVDCIGIGAGVVSRLKEVGTPVMAFQSSERAETMDRSGEFGFFNKRAEAWINMRDLLDMDSKANVCLPQDDKLAGDLTAPRLGKMLSGVRQTVEDKESIRKRLGRSTDAGDAVVMAFWPDRMVTEAASEIVVAKEWSLDDGT